MPDYIPQVTVTFQDDGVLLFSKNQIALETVLHKAYPEGGIPNSSSINGSRIGYSVLIPQDKLHTRTLDVPDASQVIGLIMKELRTIPKTNFVLQN